MKQFRKFDEKLGTITLDKQYLFAYSKDDGFSSRLLNADFTLDYEYNYTLELCAFQHKTITNNNADCLIEKGKLTGKNLELIESLLSSDYNTLKKKYEHKGLVVTDTGIQQIFINLDKATKYIHILDGLPIECFETPVEKKLYELNEHFKELIEAKYKYWIQS